MNNLVRNAYIGEYMKESIGKVFEAIVDAEIATEKKMKVIAILMDANLESEHIVEEPTFSVKPAKMKNNIYWTSSERVSLFEKMTAIWGPFISWEGTVTPGTTTFKADLVTLGKQFGRTPGAVKAQMLAAISSRQQNKNNKATGRIKAAAMTAGFIE
jgi:hypothetical protein